ncbi:MAG: hypothetical protein ABI343_06910 [Burkholderiaceae bacterium]
MNPLAPKTSAFFNVPRPNRLWTSSRRAKQLDAKTEEPASDLHHESHAIADVGKTDGRGVEADLSFIQDAWHRNTFVSPSN